MKAQEFVKQHFPDAKAINSSGCYGERNAHKYTIIKAKNDIGIEINLAEGKTESNAWVNAKTFIKQHKEEHK